MNATLKLSKRGNAQALRIPKRMHEQVGMKDGSAVEASVKGDAIVLKPVHDNLRVIRVPDLDEVFRDCTGEYHATEDPFGPAVGNEAW